MILAIFEHFITTCLVKFSLVLKILIFYACWSCIVMEAFEMLHGSSLLNKIRVEFQEDLFSILIL